MRTYIKLIPIYILFIAVFTTYTTHAQCRPTNISPIAFYFGNGGGTLNSIITYESSTNCNQITFNDVPSWLTVTHIALNTIQVVCQPNSGGNSRSTTIRFNLSDYHAVFSIWQSNTPITWYRDSDGDGYGDPNNSIVSNTTGPDGYVRDNRDCNDGNPNVNPSTPERCDGADNNCNGIVDEIVSPDVPPLPTITNNCSSTTLTMGTPPSGVEWWWQSSPTGTDIPIGSDIRSITLYSGTVYYLRARKSSTGCWSAARTINYTINARPGTPAAPTVTRSCGNTVLTRSNPPSGVTWFWQSNVLGTSTSNSGISVTKYSGTIHYLRGRNNTTGCWGNARHINYTVKAQPSPPSYPDITYNCGSTILTKGVPPNDVSWLWQSTATGTEENYNTALPTITFNSPGTYYLRAKNNFTDCWSSATRIDYVVNGVPGEAIGSDVNRCGPGPVTLTATPGSSANGIRWYTSGGALVGTDNSFTTPSHFETTTYYAESYNTNTGCGTSTSSRKAIRAVINTIPGIASGADVSRCGPGTVTLSATPGANGHTIRWYDATDTLLATGNNFTTPTINTTTTYYAESYSCSGTVCCTASRKAIRAVINPIFTWYLDADADGYAVSTTTSCTNPGTGYTQTVLPVGDCNDANTSINPDTIWYADADTDGLGDPNNPSAPSCTQPSGYVQNSNDQCPDISSPVNDCSPPSNPLDQNYIYTRTYQEGKTTGAAFFTEDDSVIQQITYFDGLGRPIQQIGIDQSPQKNDIVTHIEYDAYGRVEKEFLPYATGQGDIGSYRIDALNKTLEYYNVPTYENTPNPYSQQQLEASPLNRVLKQAAPGTDWAMDAGHEIKFGYATNVNADNVKQYNITLSFANNIYTPTLIERTDNNGLYNEGQLYKNITKDENHTGGKNHTTEEFRDKQGRVILKRTYADADLNDDGDALDPGETEVPHDTYYVYNDYGNLNFVLPPKVNTDDGVALTELDELCYQYKYDERNRLAEKKIPGKDWEYIVYNKLDQPVLTQHANLRKENSGLPYHLWQFTKYDAFGRVAYTGLTSNNSTLNVIRSRYNQATLHYETRIATPNTMDNIQVYYSKDTRPTGGMDIYTVNYYDDYLFLQSEPAPEFVNPQTVLGQSVDLNAKSLATGSKVRILETASPIQWITTVTYYDQKSRPIYVASNNEHLNTIDVIETQYDFAGKVLQTKTTHTKGSNAAIVTVDTFEYDHVGRLLTQTQKINTQDEEVIAENSYDALGQLTSKKVGGGLQKVDYTYNVRGWLKGINDVNNIGTDLFSFAIDYNNGANPLYNGNISKTSWKTANDNIARNYTYTYDALNRITAGISSDNNYNLSNVTYDKMGNILSLNRKGHTNSGATTFGDMDILSYTYDDGNKLLSVTDTANKTYGFKDGTNTNDDFEYDADGNMTLDRNKGITDITYNHLNLPKTVSIDNSEHTGTITYIYDATGTKLKKTVSEGSSLTETDYAGNYIYKNGNLEFFNQPEGIVEKEADGYKYVYQFKDHLGNIRLSYSDRDNDGKIDVLRNDADVDGDNDYAHEILEENNYYPFGMKHKGYNNLIISTNKALDYKFNGVELNEDLGLDLYEMPLRQYDPAIGRFTSIDPVTHHSMSPYVAFDNNPVFWADPSGADGEHYNWDTGRYEDDQGNEVSFETAMASQGLNADGSSKSSSEKNNDSDKEDSSISLIDEYTQRYPDKLDFKNVKTNEDKERFLGEVIEWFGFVNKFGSKSIHPGSIIDFYAESKTEKSFGQKVLSFLEDIAGGNSEDHNDVYINDGNGNTVRIGYFSHIGAHADIYSGNSVDFQEREGRISIRSHDIGSGTPQAIIFMHFTGDNKKFYNQISKRINSYQYEKVKIIPHKKQ